MSERLGISPERRALEESLLRELDDARKAFERAEQAHFARPTQENERNRLRATERYTAALRRFNNLAVYAGGGAAGGFRK